MSVSDKDRKLLWAHSGGRCAICRRLLTAHPTSHDLAAVIGEECHIAARSPTGSRAGELPHGAGVDSYDNLVLLCGSDHKRVDDQPGTFTVEHLRQLKADHEKWVAQRLDDSQPLQWQIIDDSAKPVRLELIESGQQLWNIMAESMSSTVDYPDAAAPEQTGAIADLLAQLEVVEIRDVLNMGDIVRYQAELTEHINYVRDVDLALYVGVRAQQIDVGGQRSPWSLTILRFFLAGDQALRVGA